MKDSKLSARAARAVFFLRKCSHSMAKYSGRQVKAAISGDTPAGIDSLNIIGFLQEDAPVLSAQTIATGTVIVKGEIYDYMLGDNLEDAALIAAAIKGMSQKNGMAIRVVE